MAKVHITYASDEVALQIARCGVANSEILISYGEFEALVAKVGESVDEFCSDYCQRCLKAAKADIAARRGNEKLEAMREAQAEVERALYAWWDAANAYGDTPLAQKHSAMASAMLSVLDAGMRRDSGRVS